MKELGWVVSNNERGDVVIQKDDCASVFSSDDEATQHVVDSYSKLLTACKLAYEVQTGLSSIATRLKSRSLLEQAINIAEGTT